MHQPLPAANRRRLAGTSLAILLGLTLLGACTTNAAPALSTPVPGASGATAPGGASSAASTPASTPTTTPASSAVPPAGSASAAAWCAFAIEINTKYGYMTNKRFSKTPPSLDVQRQILTEALARMDEWLAKTPPEIKDATNAEISYFQRVKAYGDANGWTNPASFPQATAAELALIGSLVSFEKTQCGIT